MFLGLVKIGNAQNSYSHYNGKKWEQISGNGKLVKLNTAVTPFSNLDISHMNAQVIVEAGAAACFMDVSIDENLKEFFCYKQEGNTLKLSFDLSGGKYDRWLSSNNTVITIKVPALELVNNNGNTSIGRTKVTTGLKPKDLIGIPWMLAFALRVDGWYLRQDIIWAKPNPMPESVRDRCTKAHEYVFLLSKSERYFYDHEAAMEPVAASTIEQRGDNDPPKCAKKCVKDNYKLSGCNKKDYTCMCTSKPFHKAAVPCIKDSCQEKGELYVFPLSLPFFPAYTAIYSPIRALLTGSSSPLTPSPFPLTELP